MDWNILWWLLAALLMLAGLLGALLPVVPGPLLVFAGVLLGAWIDDFAYIGPLTLGIFAALTVIALVMDFVAGIGGARATGAGKGALIGAAIGTVVGIFFGLPGIFLGPFIGAVIGEMLTVNDFYHATRAGIGAWFGVIVGMATKLAIGFMIIGWFLLLRLL